MGSDGKKDRSFCFSRARRLKEGRDFNHIRSSGRRLVQGCLILNWLPQPGRLSTRLGVITSRKIGNAVARSRARRLLREAYRIHQHELTQTLDLVMIARRSISEQTWTHIESDVLAALRRAGLLAPAA